MFVKELIEKLAKFDQNKEVVILDADEGNELELVNINEDEYFIILESDYNHRIRDRKVK